MRPRTGLKLLLGGRRSPAASETHSVVLTHTEMRGFVKNQRAHTVLSRARQYESGSRPFFSPMHAGSPRLRSAGLAVPGRTSGLLPGTPCPVTSTSGFTSASPASHLLMHLCACSLSVEACKETSTEFLLHQKEKKRRNGDRR